jgi:hypothetical protein
MLVKMKHLMGTQWIHDYQNNSVTYDIPHNKKLFIHCAAEPLNKSCIFRSYVVFSNCTFITRPGSNSRPTHKDGKSGMKEM